KQPVPICGSTSTCCGRSLCRCRQSRSPREASMRETIHPTSLDRWIDAWLAHQRALGRGYDNEEWMLGRLRRFVVSSGASDLDQKGFDLWCASLRHLSATTRRARQLAVRKLCLFRRRSEPDCFVPNPLYFARLRPYRRPVILGPDHVV